LGLSITRHLVLLHGGRLKIESNPGQGSTFHAYFPLPNLSNQSVKQIRTEHPFVLLVSSLPTPGSEILELSKRNSLQIKQVSAEKELALILAGGLPQLLAWEIPPGGVDPNERKIVQRLRKHPLLHRLPFVLYAQSNQNEEPSAGMTNLIEKSVQGKSLIEAINMLRPEPLSDPILVVDDDPQEREYYRALLAQEFSHFPVKFAKDGEIALEIISQTTPSLVILDLMMTGVDGFEVLAKMRSQPATRKIPVLVLSNRLLSIEDIQRLEKFSRVVLQSKGILSQRETIDAIQAILTQSEPTSIQTSAIVKRATAYFHQNYHHPFTRQEMAREIGASDDYLGRVFRQELNISPWEYLKRYRIRQAKIMLDETENSVTNIAHQVGYDDPSYFSRVFCKVVGQSPREYRNVPRRVKS